MASFDNPFGEIQVAPAALTASSTEPENTAQYGQLLNETGFFSDINFDDPDAHAVIQRYVQEVLEVNASQQQKAQEESNGAESIDGLNFENFIAPDSLNIGALPSPPDSLTAGSQAALSPFDLTVQPTNLGASGSGSGQAQMAQMFAHPAQGQSTSSPFAIGEASHPTPPTSAGPMSTSPQDAFPRPTPTQSHSAPAYLPPSGAAHANRRRAAGSWKPPTS